MNLLVNFGDEADKRRLYRTLQKLKPVRYELTLKQYRKKRSLMQNAYYHACVVAPLAAHLGYLHDDMHELLKQMFNPKYLTNPHTGEEYKIGGSTPKCDTAEFEDYLERIRTWALAELDFLIALPSEENVAIATQIT